MRPDVAVKALQLWNENNRFSFKEDLAQPAKLMKLADEVDLESMEAARFENIDPCPLFQASRLYKALQGSVAMGRYRLKPSKTPTKRVAVVCGAGLDCANGRYTWRVDRKQYEMMREYEGAAGVFSLKMDANDNLWKLCVTIRKNSNASTSTVLYSSTSTTTREPPFSSHLCLRNCNPAFMSSELQSGIPTYITISKYIWSSNLRATVEADKLKAVWDAAAKDFDRFQQVKTSKDRIDSTESSLP